jgi:hypothetical protein
MIHPSIKKLAMPIDSLLPLEGNPRRGDVDAIAASYAEFGQVKPIVVKDNEDGTFTVIAGNHQMQAAKSLGWTEIAAVVLDGDDQRAIAFALADNRTMELGNTDQAQVIDMIAELGNEYSSLLDELKWDEFEMAAMTEWANKNDNDDEDEPRGYVAPVLQNPVNMDNVEVEEDEDGGQKFTANANVDSVDAAVRGSTAVGASTSSQAIVQYTLVFDTPEQQKDWYQFIRYLRSSPVYAGTTTAEKLMDFVRSHADY